MSNRGYSGFYKGVFLRSSYEYVYARILEHDNINWKYEEITYDLGFKKYKPDFFIYSDDRKLIKIVEIKSEVIEENEIAKLSLQTLFESYGISGELVNYKHLSSMCKDRGLKITKLISEWISSENTTINKSLKGELNGNYGNLHSDKTKLLIGKKTRERWLRDPDVYLSASKKGAEMARLKLVGVKKANRINLTCEFCKKEFEIIEGKLQSFCSVNCANSYKSKLGAEKLKENAKLLRDDIKLHILSWAIKNKELILNTPYNKITNLKPLFVEIDNKFNIKDLRVISKALLNEDRGRKELLKFLKEYVQN